MITAGDVLAKYGHLGFDKVPLQTIEDKLAIAYSYCPESVWLEHTDQGVMLATLHLLSMDWMQVAEIAGAAASIAAGEAGRSPTPVENDWQLTHYGRQFESMKKSLIVGTGFAF